MSPANNSIDGLVRTTFEIGRIMRQRMTSEAKSGMNFLQLHALMIIGEQPGITMKEMAECLHITSPSATSLIDRIAKLGWIDRKHDPKNRKLVRLRIAKEGKAELAKKFRERGKIVRELFGLLTPSEQSTLTTLHEKLIREHQRLFHS